MFVYTYLGYFVEEVEVEVKKLSLSLTHYLTYYLTSHIKHTHTHIPIPTLHIYLKHPPYPSPLVPLSAFCLCTP